MQIRGYGERIRGFSRLGGYAIRWAMLSEKAQEKARILIFWEKYGLAATMEAFKVKRRTLYLWKKQLKEGAGKLESLNERSKAPHHRRKRAWPALVVAEIERLRAEHPNLSKEKVYRFLEPFCQERDLRCPRPRTIGRIIAEAPGKMRSFPVKLTPKGQRVMRKKPQKARKPKGFKPTYPGHCGAFDTVERFIDGYRRYVMTFTDVYSRYALAWATRSHGSLAAKEFFHIVSELFPYPLDYVLTDNGSEFMKHFDAELRTLHKVHWHTYPKTPKMNAHVERFNRTLQEEFLFFHEDLLLDPADFNRPLIPWLLWFNADRPHWSLNLQSPLQFINQSKKCNMYWPDTSPCLSSRCNYILDGKRSRMDGAPHPREVS